MTLVLNLGVSSKPLLVLGKLSYGTGVSRRCRFDNGCQNKYKKILRKQHVIYLDKYKNCLEKLPITRRCPFLCPDIGRKYLLVLAVAGSNSTKLVVVLTAHARVLRIDNRGRCVPVNVDKAIHCPCRNY